MNSQTKKQHSHANHQHWCFKMGMGLFFKCNGFEITSRKSMSVRTIYHLQIIWQENSKSQQRSWSATISHRPCCDWLKPVLTSCCRWQVNSVAWLVTSLQIWNSNNADVLLNSGLKLFNIMASLCSKLCLTTSISHNIVTFYLILRLT